MYSPAIPTFEKVNKPSTETTSVLTPLVYTEQVYYIASYKGVFSEAKIKVVTTNETNEHVYLLLDSSVRITLSCFDLSFPSALKLIHALEKAANEVEKDFVSLGYITSKDSVYRIDYFNQSTVERPLHGEYLGVSISSKNPDVIELHGRQNFWEDSHRFNLTAKNANKIAAALKTAMNDLKEKQ